MWVYATAALCRRSAFDDARMSAYPSMNALIRQRGVKLNEPCPDCASGLLGMRGHAQKGGSARARHLELRVAPAPGRVGDRSMRRRSWVSGLCMRIGWRRRSPRPPAAVRSARRIGRSSRNGDIDMHNMSEAPRWRVGVWLLSALLAMWAVPAAAAVSAAVPVPCFVRGRQQYEQGDFAGAVRSFERAVKRHRGGAKYHLWLGRAYGRLAEHAGWFEAMSLARSAHREFERAVALAPCDPAALSALLDYDRSAPAFLGGSAREAAALRRRLTKPRGQCDEKLTRSESPRSFTSVRR